jgi:hypothetical protein
MGAVSQTPSRPGLEPRVLPNGTRRLIALMNVIPALRTLMARAQWRSTVYPKMPNELLRAKAPVAKFGLT